MRGFQAIDLRNSLRPFINIRVSLQVRAPKGARSEVACRTGFTSTDGSCDHGRRIAVGSIATVGTVVVGAAGLWVSRRKKRAAPVAEESVTQNAGRDATYVGRDQTVIGTQHVYNSPPALSANTTALYYDTPDPDDLPEKKSRRRASARARDDADASACPEGPYIVRPGELEVVHLNIEPGDAIVGELDGDSDFDFAFMSKSKYIDYRNGGDVTFDYADDGQSAYKVKWPPRGRGPWILVLEAPRRRNDREVYAYLRLRSRG